MASRDDDDERDERRPPRRRDRDEDDDRPPRRRDDNDDDRGGRGRERDSRDDDEDDRPRRRRRRDREYDDEDYDPRPAARSGDGVVGNEIGLALGITGLVCGTSALTFSFIPCFGMWALWPGVIAAIISLIGVIVSTKMRALPIAGLVISLTAVGFAINERMRLHQAAEDVQRLMQK
jgi:hypothetical protein